MGNNCNRRKSEIKKMVTSSYGRGKSKGKVKRDIGFTETIRWYSCQWTTPGISDDCVTYSVIMPNGHRTELKYGDTRTIIIDMLENGWNCEGIWFEGESEGACTSIDHIVHKIGWGRPVWYSINEWSEYDSWKYEYVIYLGDRRPKYFAAYEIEELPDLADADEVYLEDDLVQEGPCPYDYPEEVIISLEEVEEP